MRSSASAWVRHFRRLKKRVQQQLQLLKTLGCSPAARRNIDDDADEDEGEEDNDDEEGRWVGGGSDV